MAKRQWTPAQAQAIAERDRTLLVSAAAGSGKTATLTERIIQSLTDPAGEADLSRMLVVTFTRSAAAELRSRISAALSSAIAAGGRTAHLSRQLLSLPTAKISTIDSFCLDLVRAHAVSLGLSPTFRLADVAEDKLLKNSLMRRLIEDCYDGTCEGVDAEDFCALLDCFGGARDDTLAEALLSLYETVGGYARSHHLIADIAQSLADAAEKLPFDTLWGSYIRERTQELLSSLSPRFAELLPRILGDELLCAKYPPVLEEDMALLSRLCLALRAGYADIRGILTTAERGRVPSVRGAGDNPLASEAKGLHDRLFKTVALLTKKYYGYTEEEWSALLCALAQKVALISRLLCVFSERLDTEKRRRGILSFPDLSRYAFSLLCTEEGKTPLAEELSRDFDYVYVDEYQDVNEVQHRIFEAISHPRGRFMVGDVKQSIYAFRGAQPEIFAALRRAFPPLGTPENGDTATLSLSQNFRSAQPILAFVNLVFGRHMATGLSENIGYRDEEDRLESGTGRPGPRVTLSLFLSPTKKKDAAADAEAPEAPPTEKSEGELAAAAEEEEHSLAEQEANYVAAEIARLLRAGTKKADGSLLLPSDIAILLRTAEPASQFAAALAAHGIKSECPATKGFFLSPEILLALALLNVIDNPRRDVYLAGVLRSPLYSFTMDDLIAIRTAGNREESLKNATLYEHLVAYVAANPGFSRGERFLSDLACYRRMAEGRPVDELIWQLYRESGLLSIAGADKEGNAVARRENLILLYDYARRFEGSSYRGLYNFIAYINEAIERGQSIEETREKSDHPDTVRIMTVHGSKGLEFPVCFVSDCGRNLPRDTKKRMVFDRHLGLSLKLRDESALATLNNPIFHVIEEGKERQEVEQLLRLLYVALTRPRERLYVTGTANVAEIASYAALVANGLEKATTYASTSFLKLLITALWGDDSYDLLVNGAPFLPPAVTETEVLKAALDAAIADSEKEKTSCITPLAAETQEEASVAPDEQVVAAYAETLTHRFGFVYPDQHLTVLPGKLSVSHLYPAALDETEAEKSVSTLSVEAGEDLSPVTLDELLCEEGAPSPTIPLFLGGEMNTAARAGTATHLFMQFCDFDALAKNGAQAELSRLVEKQFLSEEDAALVRMDEIRAFTRTALFAAFCEEGGKLYRELRFHVRFPASAFTALPEKKELYTAETLLVQGVMDAVRITPAGALWLIDYKTDRLSREERSDRAKAEEKLRTRHALQLSYYAAACREIFGRLPDRTLIYSLALGDTVELPVTLPEGMQTSAPEQNENE